VNSDSENDQDVFTFSPESVFTINQNGCSRCARIGVHVRPRYALAYPHRNISAVLRKIDFSQAAAYSIRTSPLVRILPPGEKGELEQFLLRMNRDMAVNINQNEFSIFSGLSAPELSLLAEAARERHFAANEKIIQKDDTGASLFLIREGRVRIELPKQDGENIQLNLMGKGEFFGEMSLLTGKPRSAVVIADIDTTVIEIDRDQFLGQIKNKPDLALKILAVLANRMQYSDDRISEIAERVYHEAYPKIDEALTSQLEAAKVVYGKTEDRASHVLASVERSWVTLTRFITIILGVASVVGAGLAYLGYSEFKEVRATIDGELETVQAQTLVAKSKLDVALEKIDKGVSLIEDQQEKANDNLNKIENIAKESVVAKEIVLTISKIRSDLIPAQYQDGDEQEQTRRLAIRFREAESQLHDIYLSKIESWHPEIILEAAITYIQFLDSSGYQPDPKYNRISQVVDALLYVLASAEPRDWRVHVNVREALVTLGTTNGGAWKKLITTSLRPKLGTTNSDLDIALVLFNVDSSSIQSKETEILMAAMYGEGSRWQRFGAAAQLIRIGEKDAWELLLTSLDNNKANGFVAAYSLAQIGAEQLVELGICDHQNLAHSLDPLQLIRQRLQLELDEGSKSLSRNPYREQHTQILIEQFAQKDCSTK
jgi:CRP-like cAMP-binding protein